MKIRITAIILAAVIALPAALSASGASTKCKTKYPLILAHGMAATDKMFGFVDYFYQIGDALANEGAWGYITQVNCMDSTYNKAVQFKTQFLQIKAATGAAKINIIGHSHGGIYTRYAMKHLGIGSSVASLTTVGSPHRGSAVADVVVGILPDSGGWLPTVINYIYAILLGDTSPNSYANAVELTRNYMNNTFNPNTTNVTGVYYQSYGTRIKAGDSALILTPTWLLIRHYEGTSYNDGLVSEPSSKWGTFRGTDSGAWWATGVSHLNQINHLFGYTPGFDAKAYFINIVADLKNKGY